MPKISNERRYILVQTYVGIIFMVALSSVLLLNKKNSFLLGYGGCDRIYLDLKKGNIKVFMSYGSIYVWEF